jgi:hypothetical protein
MTRLTLLVALVSLAPASLAQAQTNAPIHQHSTANFIDGSLHPTKSPIS